jgi:hypothetical protein
VINAKNHKMVAVKVRVDAMDTGGPTASRIVEVRSSEPRTAWATATRRRTGR